MLQIVLQDVGKQFQQKWVFRGLNLQLEASGRYALVGRNGSGKSTLLKTLSAYLSPSRGKISWTLKGNALAPEQVYRQLSIAAPYLELIEEFSLKEMVLFHRQFSPLPDTLSTEEIIELSELTGNSGKQIRHFSSGMKQRVKLLRAILPDTPLLLLDEPCTNLDRQGRQWYMSLLTGHARNKTIVVASNHNTEEYTGEFTLIHLGHKS